MKRFITLLLLLGLPALGWAQNAGPQSIPGYVTMANATTTGTTQWLLAKIDSAGKAVLAATTDTAVPLFVVRSGAGSTAGTYAQLVVLGLTSCIFDATNASGIGEYYVVASTIVAGRCHAQLSPPANGMVVGRMAQDNTTLGARSNIIAQNIAYVPGTAGSGSGTVQNGIDKSIACYAGTGTEVNDCIPAAANNLYIKWSAGSAVNSTLAAAGIGACTNQVVTSLNADAIPTCTTLTSAYVNNTIALTGAGINTSSQPINAPTIWSWTGDNTPTTLGGDVNDYTAGGVLHANTVIRLGGGAADRNITGLDAGSDGELKIIHNIGTTNALVLKNESTASSAANRLLLTPGQTTAGDVTLNFGDSFALIYDTTSSRWRPLSDGVPDKYKLKTFVIPFGSMASDAPPLVADDDLPSGITNDYRRPFKVLAVACYANTGTLTMTPILTGGTGTSIVTGACTCGVGTYAATGCTVNGTPTINPYNADGFTCASTPCSADANLTSVDGVAKYGLLKIVGILQ
jgi:hypothetical protein